MTDKRKKVQINASPEERRNLVRLDKNSRKICSDSRPIGGRSEQVNSKLVSLGIVEEHKPTYITVTPEEKKDFPALCESFVDSAVETNNIAEKLNHENDLAGCRAIINAEIKKAKEQGKSEATLPIDVLIMLLGKDYDGTYGE